MNIKQQQKQQLFSLLSEATGTEYGTAHFFEGINSYKEFRNQLPLMKYGDIADQIQQLKEGSADLLWPGQVNKFAVSAGTSGTGKHLPLSRQRLKSDRSFMRKVAGNYLRQRPNILRILGKHISLPGSMENKGRYQIGEISAFSAQQAPPLLKPFQLIKPEELLQLPFSKKIERILNKAINQDIRVITAVPSWLLTIFQHILERSKAESIIEVWPNLQLMVCGGVKLANYRAHLEQLINKPDVDFIETYGASEGYFSFSDDLSRDDMRLVINNGIFYEFIPNPQPGDNPFSPQDAIPLWEVETGVPYAMIVSTNAGLWRYVINDIVTFTKTAPPRIQVLGRVSEMLDDYGEALYAYEAQEALEEAVSRHNIQIDAFTVGASMNEKTSLPRHIWFIQGRKTLTRESLEQLATTLDEALQERNRHYSIRRESGALSQPELYSIDQQKINRWLQKKGKNKAQGKLPSILRDQQDIQFFKSS